MWLWFLCYLSQSARDTHLGYGVDALLDLCVGATLLGRVQREEFGEGFAHHGLVGVLKNGIVSEVCSPNQ